MIPAGAAHASHGLAGAPIHHAARVAGATHVVQFRDARLTTEIGARHGPQTPTLRHAPAQPWRASSIRQAPSDAVHPRDGACTADTRSRMPGRRPCRPPCPREAGPARVSRWIRSDRSASLVSARPGQVARCSALAHARPAHPRARREPAPCSFLARVRPAHPRGRQEPARCQGRVRARRAHLHGHREPARCPARVEARGQPGRRLRAPGNALPPAAACASSLQIAMSLTDGCCAPTVPAATSTPPSAVSTMAFIIERPPLVHGQEPRTVARDYAHRGRSLCIDSARRGRSAELFFADALRQP
jgi:hypothetical protein